jgi:hypothetical protein
MSHQREGGNTPFFDWFEYGKIQEEEEGNEGEEGKEEIIIKKSELIDALFNYNFDMIRMIINNKMTIKSVEDETKESRDNKIDCSKFPKDINLTKFAEYIIPYITDVNDLNYLINSYDIPYLNRIFPSILETNNLNIIEHILLISCGTILPITGIKYDEPLINNIEIIQLLQKYGYFKNADILYQKSNNITLAEVIIQCDFKVIRYIINNIYPLYRFSNLIQTMIEKCDVELTTFLIKNGITDIYRYYIANMDSYKYALLVYDEGNIEGYRHEEDRRGEEDRKNEKEKYFCISTLVSNVNICKIIATYLDPREDLNLKEKDLEIERQNIIYYNF